MPNGVGDQQASHSSFSKQLLQKNSSGATMPGRLAGGGTACLRTPGRRTTVWNGRSTSGGTAVCRSALVLASATDGCYCPMPRLCTALGMHPICMQFSTKRSK